MWLIQSQAKKKICLSVLFRGFLEGNECFCQASTKGEILGIVDTSCFTISKEKDAYGHSVTFFDIG